MPQHDDAGARRSIARQRRGHLAMDDDWIQSFLEHAAIAHVGTVDGDQPFVVPTTFWFDAARRRIYFHSSPAGRLFRNCQRAPRVCLEVSCFGNLLGSNVALEFSIQYASVLVFGMVRILDDARSKEAALAGLIAKYFPTMESGRHYRPITDTEIARTAVYELAIDAWSGKRNWPDRADQADDWPPLAAEYLQQAVDLGDSAING